ncbi:hypothetical protein FSP39_013314 [Pinctada imbricata]|uniref:Uncharacterized protein n=1 Tax=Pinctada imbricata TaxID=66713 RepID=A0AA88XH39_PINIB|nr:hypothetical protein FSP39_013314 [Pinctada imbricata]
MASAILPERRNRDESIKRQQSRPTKEILMQMGFSEKRAEKATAATGDRGIQLASDWLLSHINDPLLDEGEEREYILYLCPSGPLQKNFDIFWNKSLNQCGWNGAHSYFPHITLSPFFKAPNSKVEALSKAFANLDHMMHNAPCKLEFDFFSQINFIGLFAKEGMYQYLLDIVSHFSKEAQKYGNISFCSYLGIAMEPHKKQLHITLAYQYSPEQHDTLLKLAKEIDINADGKWELRLFSRDPKFGKSDVRNVIKDYTPQVGDELELIEGDYIFMDHRELEKSKDGWYQGTSWLTGNSGMFPGNYTHRTAETWTWTLHRYLCILLSFYYRSLTMYVKPTTKPISNGFIVEEDYDSILHDEKNYAKVVRRRQSLAHPGRRTPRCLYVLRHGERIDFALGKSWFDMCYDDEGKYSQVNLNMPKKMLKRKTHLEFIKDTPLTNVGKLQARLTGEHFKDTDINISLVFCSPALRCIQTANEVYTALGLQNKIKIEPGLFEWTGHIGIPRWMSPEELEGQGYPIDLGYTPQIPIEKLRDEESVEHLYARSTECTRQILHKYEKQDGSVLLVGHAGTLELCTRILVGQSSRPLMKYREILPKVPYVSVCAIEEDLVTKKWTFLENQWLPLTHGRNTMEDLTHLLKNT